jgi:2-methylcitrate dehydratase PrpD
MNLGFKPFAACGLTHAPLTGVFQILKNHPVEPEEIEMVNVRSFKFALEMNDTEPASPNAASFSIPYTVACALVDRSAMPEVFTRDAIKDPRRLGIAKKVNILWDPAYEPEWTEKHRCSVEIVTKTGEVFTYEVNAMKGSPDLPLSDEEIVGKFEKLTVETLGKDRAAKIIETVFCLEKLNDMGALIELLRR